MRSYRLSGSRVAALFAVAAILGLSIVAATWFEAAHMGPQSDGSFVLSTGQRIGPGSISFAGRPSDLAAHPGDNIVAVVEMNSVFLCRSDGIIQGSAVPLGASPGFHGLGWAPDGKHLYASTASGTIQVFDYDEEKLTKGATIKLLPSGQNAVPGGMAFTKDGKFLYVACANYNQVSQLDLSSNTVVKTFPTENLPFTVKLSADEKSLIVSDWGGRPQKNGENTAYSGGMQIVVDPHGAAGTGEVSLIDIASGQATQIPVGLHPTDIAISGTTAWVANSMSDTISEIDLTTDKVAATIPLAYKDVKILGAMPVALFLQGNKLYVADGGDNALAVVDVVQHKVDGYFPCGYYPIAIGSDGKELFVLNSKGDGSVLNTVQSKPGNSHDFQGTITVINPASSLVKATAVVASNNRWLTTITKPKLAVYNGAITHVIYIIKENRTYDEFYGDMDIGDGDAKLCDVGAKVVPNHQQIVRDFTLFDNAYVSGTNSADGHAWTDESLADDYLEHFYVGYSRSYPFEGSDSMAISTGGCLWDAAAAKHKSIRDYGEFAAESLSRITPTPKNWFDCWKDRQAGGHKFVYTADTTVAGLKPYISHAVQQFPLVQSDQAKADVFLAEYAVNSKADSVPNLTFISLPCDHTNGADPNSPQPASMLADNDVALGRIVDGVSHSPQWKNTCIFVIEDDAQAGLDHVDGHRTSYMVISPYNKRHTVDSNLYTTTNMVRSIEMMLGLDPMNRFDLLSKPIDSCFTDKPDLTPYTLVANSTPLDLKNPGYNGSAMTSTEKYWAQKTKSLDWSHLDAPDPYWLNRVIWASMHHYDATPYPGRTGDLSGAHDTD